MCPKCQSLDSRVLETRITKEKQIRRRRECLACKTRFTTLETVIKTLPYVYKKDGRKEVFSVSKLRQGLELACKKRPVTKKQIDEIVKKVTQSLMQSKDSEVPSYSIGQAAMKELKKIDEVSYVRFISVHRNFKDISEFVNTIHPKVTREKSH